MTESLDEVVLSVLHSDLLLLSTFALMSTEETEREEGYQGDSRVSFT